MLVCTVWCTTVCSSAVFVLFRMNFGPCLKMCSSAVFVLLGCRLTRGASRQTAALSSEMRKAFVTIATATWPPGTRDWVWDLAAGAMPTGRNAMLPSSPSSRCLYCAEADSGSTGGTADAPKNSIAHLLQCPRYKQVADWTAKMCEAIGAPMLNYNSLIPFGFVALSNVRKCHKASLPSRQAAVGRSTVSTLLPDPSVAVINSTF